MDEMVEDFETVEGGDSAREVAAQRWQAIEAFNTIPGLTAIARRVGIALICFMDAQTRATFPSEARLAAELGINIRSVKRAKEELKEAGLIEWYNPGGPRHQSRYGFGWTKLLQERDEAKSRGDLAIVPRAAVRPNGDAHAPNTQRNGGVQTTNDVKSNVTVDTPKVAPMSTIGGVGVRQGGVGVTPKGVPTPPDTTHYLPTDIAQPYHDVFTSGAAALRNGRPLAAAPDPVFDSIQAAPKEGAQEIGAATKFRCAYPKLMSTFEDDETILEAITRLNSSHQARASVALAREGRDAALEAIMKGNLQ